MKKFSTEGIYAYKQLLSSSFQLSSHRHSSPPSNLISSKPFRHNIFQYSGEALYRPIIITILFPEKVEQVYIDFNHDMGKDYMHCSPRDSN